MKREPFYWIWFGTLGSGESFIETLRVEVKVTTGMGMVVLARVRMMMETERMA